MSLQSNAPFKNMRTGVWENQAAPGKFEVAFASYCRDYLGIEWSTDS